jgi:hypothetical protein
VGAVTGVEEGQLSTEPDGGVGGEGGVAPPVGFFERIELGAGMGRSRRTITRVPDG